MPEGDRSLAIFVDFENLALGFQGRRDRFDIVRVLERLVEKGKIVAKKAYADWSRFSSFTHALHEAAIELVEIPRRGQSGKNSADIRLCVDAMDLAYSKEHINTFAIISGDSDFSPLVSKLKELGKHVIGLGMQESTSDLLRDNCDEFIYYEDLGQPPRLAPDVTQQLPDQKRKGFELLLESLAALRRENKDVLWSSMIKDTMKRKKPSFNETYHGYRTFSELLEDAAHEGILELDTDKRSRTYVVTRFGPEMHEPPANLPHLAHLDQADAPNESSPPPRSFGEYPPPPAQEEAAAPEGFLPRRRSRRRRRRGQGGMINGNPAPSGMPMPVPGFQPIEIPSPGPVVGIPVVPSPVILTPAVAPPPPVRRPVEAPPPVVETPPEPKEVAIPASEEEVTPATPRSRTRSARTPRTGTTPRAPRRTTTPRTARSRKSAEADETTAASEPDNTSSSDS
ncbi:MAG: NYN domain-containing protein [Gemmataceae bacterium]